MSGIRDLHPDSVGFVRSALHEAWTAHAPRELRVGGALGVDTEALQAAHAMGAGWRLVVYAPGFTEDLPRASRLAVEHTGAYVVELGQRPLLAWAFLRRNVEMMAGADRLLAFTDGRLTGGTAHAITAARSAGLAVDVVMVKRAIGG